MVDSTTPPAPQTGGEILLESGTNELEVLIFKIGDGTYGVNVAKVREVILPVPVVASPDQPPAVMGMFNLRGNVLPLVNMHQYFQIDALDDDSSNYRVIVTEFNGARAAFLVETVEQIHRMSWTRIRPVPNLTGNQQLSVTGILELDDRLVLMLDFESIYDHISMEDRLHIDHVENKLGVDRAGSEIFLAEDSNFIRGVMESVLDKSGYSRVTSFTNGADAWNTIQQIGDDPSKALPDVIITDIEMPQMDGLALTRNIKNHPRLREIPVLLFSSLVTDDTRHRGEQVGADDQLSKPQLAELVQIVDQWLAKRQAQTVA